MTAIEAMLFGPLRAHPAAIGLAREVVRVNRRYATEVVAEHRLCPFLRDVDTGFGRFCVGMTRAIDLGEATEAFLRAENPVVHIVYPLLSVKPSDFERFGGDVGRSARDQWRGAPAGEARFGPEPPVIATFHPDLAGDRSAPHRLIGMLRRSPDPFVQIIPGGHYESGTVVAPLSELGELSPEALQKILAKVPPPKTDRIAETFGRLNAALLDEIEAKISEIRADRDRSYAPFLKELAAA